MTPPGKIINIDAFKHKESGVPASSKTPKNTGARSKRKDRAFATLLVLSVTIAMSFMMTPASRKVVLPPVDSITPHNIKALEDMLVEDKESTEKNRLLVRDAVLDVYDFDSGAAKLVITKISEAFSSMANAYKAHDAMAYKDVMADLARSAVGDTQFPVDDAELEKRLAVSKKVIAKFEQSEEFLKLETGFTEKLGLGMDDKMRQYARHYHYSPDIAKRLSSIVASVYAKGVVARKSQLPPSSATGMNLRDLTSGAERVIRDFKTIYDLPEALALINEQVSATQPKSRPGLKKLVTHFLTKLVQPNITFNRKETDIRKEKAVAEAKPVFFHIQRGEMIIREGERVTPIHLAKLQYMASQKSDIGRLKIFAGLALLTFALMSLAAFFMNKFHEEIRTAPKMQLLLALLLVAHMGLVFSATQIFTVFTFNTPGVELQTYLLAAPLVFGPMIVSIFFTTELTILFTVVAALLTGVLLREFSVIPLLTMTGGMICAYEVRNYNKRSSVLKVGFFVAVANVIVAFALDMIGGFRVFPENIVPGLLFAFAGGAVSALFVSGIIPFVESFFPVVSDFKLMELININHPLLRRMIVEAPGTYQHSMMVGALSEEACKAIGANSLLARAGAQFHDIGKMRKSEYFVENQREGENPHDKLSPSMSTLVLVNHIKEGLDLARQYKLLPQITAMIPEHHGTQVVRYFYEKAKDSEDISRNEVKEADFRYPGPVPSSKESACVALADSIEAAARSCKDPSPAKLKAIVTGAINDKFMQGQLDNSHLTLKDLALIAESFLRVLTAMHHHRITYPEATKPKARERRSGNGHTSSQTQETREAKNR